MVCYRVAYNTISRITYLTTSTLLLPIFLFLPFLVLKISRSRRTMKYQIIWLNLYYHIGIYLKLWYSYQIYVHFMSYLKMEQQCCYVFSVNDVSTCPFVWFWMYKFDNEKANHQNEFVYAWLKQNFPQTIYHISHI